MKHLTLALLLLSPVPALAQCIKPNAPDSLPDGSRAVMEDMVTAQQAVKEYMAGTNDYLECLEAETPPPGDEEPEAAAARNNAYNAAVDEMERVAADFNEQLRAYRANAAE